MLSSLVWPSGNCTARRFFVRRQINEAFVRRMVCEAYAVTAAAGKHGEPYGHGGYQHNFGSGNSEGWYGQIAYRICGE